MQAGPRKSTFESGVYWASSEPFFLQEHQGRVDSPLAVGQGCEVQFTFRPVRHVQIWQGWWSGTQVSRN